MSQSFSDLGVSDAIASRLIERGITEPFPIQAATLPDALAGRDVCGRAPTGSGKTMAFGIPLVERVGRAKPRRPRGLVLVPTRELATQVADELEQLAGRKGPSVVTLYGGVGFGPQLAALRRGVEIAVACPGRLADLINRGDLKLDDVEFVVLDEADRMADMGFLPEVRRILDQVKPNRQTLLFSATLDGDVNVIIKHYQKNPARHELEIDEDQPQNQHVFWKLQKADRVELTADLAKRHWPTVVFCRTKRGADRLAEKLGKLGVSAAAIHGDRSQRQREHALAQFSTGRVQALIATDVAARGIHVDDVACVVHFDPPADEKDYVHRSGRTGRAGRTGLVVSMVGGDQVGGVRRMQKTLGMTEGIVTADMEALNLEGNQAVAPAPRPKRIVETVSQQVPNRGRSGSGRGSRSDPRFETTRPTDKPGATRSRRPSTGESTGGGATAVRQPRRSGEKGFFGETERPAAEIPRAVRRAATFEGRPGGTPSGGAPAGSRKPAGPKGKSTGSGPSRGPGGAPKSGGSRGPGAGAGAGGGARRTTRGPSASRSR